jgi:WhiB family redox-sensing transcriptional regulator
MTGRSLRTEVATAGLGAEVWPAWAPPGAAVGAWNALQGALVLLGWRVACVSDPEAWWSTAKSAAGAERQADAVEACSWCPVIGFCRDYALVAREVEGVWGGTTPAERRARNRVA